MSIGDYSIGGYWFFFIDPFLTQMLKEIKLLSVRIDDNQTKYFARAIQTNKVNNNLIHNLKSESLLFL